MRTRGIVGPGLCLLAAAAAGCGGGPVDEVIVDGSSTVFRISRAAQEAFAKVEPDITVVVDNHGTGGGFGRYLQGEVDVVDASRDAKPAETSQAAEKGLDWTRYVVGHDGITVVVHPKNDFVEELSVDQLKALWAQGSRVRTWKDLDPAWPDRKIVLYCPDPDSGTREFFVEAILGKDKSQRDDAQASSDDNTLVTGVASDADGLGYFGFAYYKANAAKLRAIPVRNGPDAEPVTPSLETIFDGSYLPLSRPLFLFVKDKAMGRPAVSKFVSYYLANVGTLAEKGGYVAPTEEERAANQSALATAPKPAPAVSEE